MKSLKPNFSNLSKKHLQNIDEGFSSLWVEILHTQKKGIPRPTSLKRTDKLKIRFIDKHISYPLSKEVVEVCNKFGIPLPSDNLITKTFQGTLNKKLRALGYHTDTMIEHCGLGLQGLVELMYECKLSSDEEIGINQLKDLYFKHTNCFYRFVLGTKKDGTPVNKRTGFTIEEAIELI